MYNDFDLMNRNSEHILTHCAQYRQFMLEDPSQLRQIGVFGHHLRKNSKFLVCTYNARKHLMNINSNSNQRSAKRIAQLGEMISCFFMRYWWNIHTFCSLCPIHVLTFTLISNLAADYIQKRRRVPGLVKYDHITD